MRLLSPALLAAILVSAPVAPAQETRVYVEEKDPIVAKKLADWTRVGAANYLNSGARRPRVRRR